MSLLDRTRRPARPLRAVIEATGVFHKVATRLRRLPSHLAGSARAEVASQHALSASTAPELVRPVLHSQPDATVRLRSANRDDLALLMTQQANVMVAFETDDLPIVPGDHSIEKCQLAGESLIPVVAPDSPVVRSRDAPYGELPIIFYPGSSPR